MMHCEYNVKTSASVPEEIGAVIFRFVHRTLAPTYQSSQRHIAEDCKLQLKNHVFCDRV
jgi:hypothetical protein